MKLLHPQHLFSYECSVTFLLLLWSCPRKHAGCPELSPQWHWTFCAHKETLVGSSAFFPPTHEMKRPSPWRNVAQFQDGALEWESSPARKWSRASKCGCDGLITLTDYWIYTTKHLNQPGNKPRNCGFSADFFLYPNKHLFSFFPFFFFFKSEQDKISACAEWLAAIFNSDKHITNHYSAERRHTS